MTVTVPVKTGTFDGIAPNPCGSSAPGPVTCATVCDGLELAKYAAGALCPLNRDVTLYSDDFTGYVVGSAIPNPPWTEFTDLAGQTFVQFVADVGGVKCAACRFTGNGVTPTAWRGLKFNQGYASFDSNPCGVFTEAIYRGRITSGGSGNSVGGLCIGMNSATSDSRIGWYWHAGNGSGPGLNLFSNWGSGGTSLDNGAAYQPVVGDRCRLKLLRTGAFGWRLQAFINDVQVGIDIVSSNIQLSHASPKAVGYFFGGNGLAFHGATPSEYYISDWKGGVCG